MQLAAADAGVGRLTMRRLLLAALAGALLVAGALGVQRLATRSAAPDAARPAGLDTVAVTRRDLVSRERVNGTLGYDQEYDVANQYTRA